MIFRGVCHKKCDLSHLLRRCILSVMSKLLVRRVMPIIIRLDVLLAQKKMKSRELARVIGITEQNLSLLKSGKVKSIRFDTLQSICEALSCQPGDVLEYLPEPLPEK
ncbi:transcriptional regulator, XRE family [Dickeya chrysanthemi Ech1591]|uniref:Transcriptional regulator, XRE family n=2 Tax=Pectobacteriaceae TaxID=1903410 RepID=C6CIT3_DICC1|nr:transcriptional regulator, XRE family [Dickeya chrysanthemi Ech1591]